MGRDRQVGGIRKWWHSRLGAPLLLEIVIVVTLLLIYKAARLLAEGDHEIAVQHALQVIDIERALGVFNEENAQRLVIKSTAAIKFLNVYYLWAHFSVTIAMLVRVLAQELRADHIAVNEIVPGPVRTVLIENLPSNISGSMAGVATEWFKTPEAVADLALYLARLPNDGATGQTFSLLGRDM